MTHAAAPAPRALDAQGPLQRLLDESKVLVTVGSGGVGKTTTAAALAIAAARRGRRVAVLTIDPAKRLAQALGLPHLDNEARPLPAELVAPGAVDAMMLETSAAFDDLIARLVPDPDRQERLLQNRLYQVIARHLGGTHEYMAVERLYALTRDDRYDLVVLDTPPSVNALDFLDAPQRLIHFFSERVTRFFIKRSESDAKGLFARLRDRAGELALSILGKAFGESFMEEVQHFSTAFQGLFAAFRERGLAIDALLRSPATSFLVVSAADPVRVAEALEFSAALSRLDIEAAGFIVNRVHLPKAHDPDPIDEAALANLLRAAAADDVPGASACNEALGQARRVRQSMARRDAEGLDALRRAQATERIIVVPELSREVQDRDAVEHVLEALGSPRR